MDKSQIKVGACWVLKFVVHWILIVGFLFAMAFALAWFMQYRYLDNDTMATWKFVNEQAGIFWYGVWAIGMVLGLASAIIGRPLIVAGVSWAVVIIAMFANANKMELRGAPLLPEDLQMVDQAGSLTDFVDSGELTQVIIASVLLVVAGFLANHVARKIWSYSDRDQEHKRPFWRRHAIIQRAIIAILLCGGTIKVLEPICNHHSEQHLTILDSIGAEAIVWSQIDNYLTNGFVFGFMYNCGKTMVESPENYNEDAVKQIAEQYNKKQRANTESNKLSDVADNIIVILDESFHDPKILEEYYQHDGGDITPNLHRVMSENPSGYMYTPLYGGGTADAEAEIFSGLTNYWTNTNLYVDMFSKSPIIPSIATFAKSNSFQTTAIHSYNGTMYKRNFALAKEGFDKFIDIEEMNYKHYTNGMGYLDDWSIYHEALDIIKDNDDKQMIGMMTMQNHAPAGSPRYDETYFKLSNETPYYEDDAWQNDLENYYQNLYYADKYLGEFLSAIDTLNERTVVLWFGDHSLGIYNKLLENGDEQAEDLIHQTPYFVYTNFALNETKQTLPTTTPNCLINTMYNTIKSDKPTMGYLLDEVCEKTPILTNVYLRGEEPEYTDALKAYQMLNYDIMSGDQYWLKYANNY